MTLKAGLPVMLSVASVPVPVFWIDPARPLAGVGFARSGAAIGDAAGQRIAADVEGIEGHRGGACATMVRR